MKSSEEVVDGGVVKKDVLLCFFLLVLCWFANISHRHGTEGAEGKFFTNECSQPPSPAHLPGPPYPPYRGGPSLPKSPSQQPKKFFQLPSPPGGSLSIGLLGGWLMDLEQ